MLTALTGDVHSAARQLGREVERIREATSAEQVHVVGHLSLPVDSRAAHLVASTLAQLKGSPASDLTAAVSVANAIGPSPTSVS